MTFPQAMFLAVLQGVSELFPVSSLGHAVLVPAFLGWHIDQSAPTWLAFIVVLHLGTAAALLIYYRREWYGIIGALVASIVRGKRSDSPDEHLGWLLVIGSVPAGVLGAIFEHQVRMLLASPLPASCFLMVNALIMFAGERLRRRQHEDEHRSYRSLREIGWRQAVFVGCAQSLALLPGISRSGSSIVAGLLVDLTHAQAARYSFLLATPIIAAAGLLEVPRVFAAGVALTLAESLAGGVLAGVTAYLSVAFLERYFRSNDLRPFGWYCLIVGALGAALFSTGVLK